MNLKIAKGVLPMTMLPFVAACSLFAGGQSMNADVDNAALAKQSVHKPRQGVTVQNTFKGSGASLFDKASAMARSGDHNAAIPIFRHLMASDDTMRHREALAKSLLAVGQASEAASLLETAMTKGGTGSALYVLGKSWLALGRYDEALGAFSEAANKMSGDPRPRSARGVTFAALGQVDDAINSFDMALRVRSMDREILSNKALVLSLSDRSDEAVKILEKLVADGNARARDRQNLSLAYLMQGEEDKAKAMGRLDLDDESLAETFRFYNEISNLPVEYRMRALVAGAIDPAWTSRESGNLKLAENSASEAAAKRLIEKPKPEPKPKPKPEPKPEPVIPPLLEPEGWAVQIGAYRTIKNLVRGWDILKERNADILEGIPPRRSEKDFGPVDGKPSGFYYRLNAGPLESFAKAKELCNAFKERGTDCWIRPPEKAEGKLPSKKK